MLNKHYLIIIIYLVCIKEMLSLLPLFSYLPLPIFKARSLVLR